MHAERLKKPTPHRISYIYAVQPYLNLTSFISYYIVQEFSLYFQVIPCARTEIIIFKTHDQGHRLSMLLMLIKATHIALVDTFNLAFC